MRGMGGMGPGMGPGIGGGMRGMGGMGSMGGMGGGMRGMGGGMAGMGPMGGMGGMTPEAMQQFRMQRIQTMLQSIDTNHNGTIEPEEAQGPNAFMLDRMLRGAGIEPKYPMPISKITEAMTNQFRIQNGQSALPSTPEKTAEEAKPGDAASAPLVPGFGEVASVKLTPIPGFGTAIPVATAGAKKSGSSGDTSSSSTTSTRRWTIEFVNMQKV